MNSATHSPRPSLPLTPAVFAILLALADGEKHGYAIMREARQHTAMGPGTLYGSLDRLLSAGLVEETAASGPPEEHDARRRFYRISNQGAAALAIDTNRLERAAAMSRKKGVRSVEVSA